MNKPLTIVERLKVAHAVGAEFSFDPDAVDAAALWAFGASV